MVSLLTPDVGHFIGEAKEKSVTAVTLLSNRKKLSRAGELPQSGICCGERPFFPNDPLSANKELVLNRCRALQIGRRICSRA
jgi:hypothetical protein